jgi:hypothetical protein
MTRTFLVLFIFLFVGLGCASSTTGQDTITYGMTQAEAIEKLEAAGDRIVSVSKDEVVAVGVWELLQQKRKKVLRFQDGKLANVSYEPLEE